MCTCYLCRTVRAAELSERTQPKTIARAIVVRVWRLA